MERNQTATPDELEDEAAQTGEDKGVNKQEQLKRLIRQHPQRESPRVDGQNEESP